MSENIVSIISKKIEILNELKEELKGNIKLPYTFRDANYNIFLVTNDDKVHCFGSNFRGLLGFGHKNSIDEFTINDDLSNKQIIQFNNSDYHTIGRTLNGKIYCWGKNEKGVLGNGSDDKEKIFKPELNKSLLNENIKDVSCGYYHTLVLTSNGEVHAWGYNIDGQIGNQTNEDVLVPFKLNAFNGEKVKAISCGWNHSMVLTESGRVFSWGYNSCGQLGIGNKQSSNSPKLIKLNKNIIIDKINCGTAHSLLLSSEKDIYVFGSNEYRQLGRKSTAKERLIPKKLENSNKFREIATHYNYDISCALSESSSYYVWGHCGKKRSISVPKETQYECFEDLFIELLEITVKTIQYQYHIESSLIPNGKYMRNWIEKSKIGGGDFGEVFKVESNLNQIKEFTSFAIKKIPIKDSYSIKELLNMSNIQFHSCEFLVKYFDGWYENNFETIQGFRKYSENYTIYIQMELCDKTLIQIIQEVNEDIKLKCNSKLTFLGYYISSEIFIEILEGFKYLHNHSIIHRDLKPDNILFKNGIVKIADFGLAKVHDKKLNTQDIGNRGYMAPEVQNSRNYDTKADIYSLGVLLTNNFFDIDFNNSNQSLSGGVLEQKNDFLKGLNKRMRDMAAKDRPDCEQILRERLNWALNKNEFNFEEELNILLESCVKTYVQLIICSKLSNINIFEKFSLPF